MSEVSTSEASTSQVSTSQSSTSQTSSNSINRKPKRKFKDVFEKKFDVCISTIIEPEDYKAVLFNKMRSIYEPPDGRKRKEREIYKRDSKHIAGIISRRYLSDRQKNLFIPTVDINERLELIEIFLYTLDFYRKSKLDKIPKENGYSAFNRYDGDEFFKNGEFNKALEKYTNCIAMAVTECFLRIGYAKRSSVLFEFKLYKECLHDIQLATKSKLQILPDIIRIYPPGYDLPTAKQMNAINIEELQKRKEMCEKIIQNLPLPDPDVIEIQNSLKKLTHLQHSKISFIANCLEMKKIVGYGRSIVTNMQLNVGDVIAIEKPFASVLCKTLTHRYCTNCLKETIALRPCPSCFTVMFCSQKCLKIAYAKFHKYECDIIDYLLDVFPPNRLIGIRVFIQAIVLFKDIDRLIDFDKNTIDDKNIFNIESDKMDYDYNYDGAGDDDDNEDYDYNDYKSYSTKMTEINYYPVHDLLKDLTELANRSKEECLENTIEIVLATNILVDHLTDFVKTDEHKRFIENFMIRQFELARTHGQELCYSEEDTSDSLVKYRNVVYGSAIYPFTALINHSCAPNIATIYNGCNVTIVVLRPINKGEQLFYSYCDTYGSMKREEREAFLASKHLFHCKCEACERDFPLAKDLIIIPQLPIIPEDFQSKSDNFNDVRQIKSYFEYLNAHSIKKNYPCQQIEMIESKLKNMISYRLRHD